MPGHADAGDYPSVYDVPRTFCKEHCAAWIKRKDKKGRDISYCGHIITDPTRTCGCTWSRIREKMR